MFLHIRAAWGPAALEVLDAAPGQAARQLFYPPGRKQVVPVWACAGQTIFRPEKSAGKAI